MIDFSTFLRESKKPLLNALEKEFGTSIYDEDLNILPTYDVISRIFNILNRIVFNLRLCKINIKCASSHEIYELLTANGAKGYTSDSLKHYYALYVPIANIVGNIHNAKFIFNDEYLIINTDHGKMTMAFLISSICHEMIHQYDAHYGDLAKFFKIQMETGEQCDTHTTSIFKRKMNFVNNNNFTVIPNGKGMSFAELNEYMARRMNGLVEAEKPSTEQVQRALAANGVTQLSDGSFIIVFGN